MGWMLHSSVGASVVHCWGLHSVLRTYAARADMESGFDPTQLDSGEEAVEDVEVWVTSPAMKTHRDRPGRLVSSFVEWSATGASRGDTCVTSARAGAVEGRWFF